MRRLIHNIDLIFYMTHLCDVNLNAKVFILTTVLFKLFDDKIRRKITYTIIFSVKLD